MTFEEIQGLIEKDEHRCLELKKTTGEWQDSGIPEGGKVGDPGS